MENRHVQDLINDGWQIRGYSVCMMAAGATTHNILLQKDDCVEAVTVVVSNGKELGRNHVSFSPKPPEPEKKKGWFK